MFLASGWSTCGCSLWKEQHFKVPLLGSVKDFLFGGSGHLHLGNWKGHFLKLWKWNAVAVQGIRYQRDSKYNLHVQSFWCAPNQTHDNSRQYHECVLTKTLSTDLTPLRSRPRQTWCLLFYSAKIDWRIETLKHGKVVEKSTSFQSLTTEALSQMLRCCLKREHRNEKASDKRKKETLVNSCRDILIYGPHQDRWNVSRYFLASHSGCQQLVPSNHQIWGIPSAWNSISNIPNPWRFTGIFDVPNLL